MKKLSSEARALAAVLKSKKTKIVFTESCTGGLVSASLAQVPGISNFLCGSAVVYRTATKARWLGVSKKLLNTFGPVSPEVTLALAQRVLKCTPEAHLAAAVTGDLGPVKDFKMAGVVNIAVVFRKGSRGFIRQFQILPQRSGLGLAQSAALRIKRQALASHAVLFMVRSLLK